MSLIKSLFVGLVLFSSLSVNAEVFSGKLATLKTGSIPTECTYPFHGGICSFSALLKAKTSAEYVRITNLSMPSSSFFSFFDVVSGDTKKIDFNIEYDGFPSEENVMALLDGENTIQVEFVEAGEETLTEIFVISTPIKWRY